MDSFQSFLDATPEKGVIIVEYYWQSRSTGRSRDSKEGSKAGANTSLVFFKRIRASDPCWCGSMRRFARCHRRDDDWTYVTLDPDGHAYSPVVLLERAFGVPNTVGVQRTMKKESGLLPVGHTESLAAWCVPFEPALVNENGQLILGTIGVSERQLHLETNSEKRFDHLLKRFQTLLGDFVGSGATFRAEPQKAFPVSSPAKRRRRAAQ